MDDDRMTWVKARRCETSSCVEVTNAGHAVLVRDSKAAGVLPLAFTRQEWEAFLEDVKAGKFDQI